MHKRCSKLHWTTTPMHENAAETHCVGCVEAQTRTAIDPFSGSSLVRSVMDRYQAPSPVTLNCSNTCSAVFVSHGCNSWATFSSKVICCSSASTRVDIGASCTAMAGRHATVINTRDTAPMCLDRDFFIAGVATCRGAANYAWWTTNTDRVGQKCGRQSTRRG